MTYKGIVRGRMIELSEGPMLPEGMEVEVVVGERAEEAGTRGERDLILAALDAPAHCTEADVDALMEAIEQGKRDVRFAGPFEHAGRSA